jgi:Tfp pilus assembly protein PilP
VSRRARRVSWLALAGVAALGAVGVVGISRAQAPVAPAADPTASRPTAPGLGAVKETLADSVKQAVGSAQGAPAAAPAAVVVAAPPVNANDPAARAAALRRKTLKDLDFVDSDDSNRDPFKSFMSLFVDKGSPKVRQVPAIFEKFALEELSLIAIVSGDAQPRAMFRDPGGLGQTIKRGDYVSKSGARVTKILSDRVILEITEMTASGEPRAVEKAVLVNPEEEAAK